MVLKYAIIQLSLLDKGIEMGFTGRFDHQLDGKNRIRIPAKFRAVLGKNYSFMCRPGGCIGVYSKEALDEFIEKLNAASSGDREKLDAKRVIMAGIEDANEDDQGRVLLSANCRRYAKITKNVVTVGMGEYLEIWDEDIYRQKYGNNSIEDAFDKTGLFG